MCLKNFYSKPQYNKFSKSLNTLYVCIGILQLMNYKLCETESIYSYSQCLMFAGQTAQYLSKAFGEKRSKWIRILSILLGISSAIYMYT